MSRAKQKKRPMLDYNEIVNDPDSPFKVTLEDNDINKWLVEFDGPSDTYYEGLHFRLSVDFPDNYPFGIPKLRFLSKVFHPNVYSDGRICLDTIQSANYSPAIKMDGVLMGLLSLLDDANPKSPANGEAARIWKKSGCREKVRSNHRV